MKKIFGLTILILAALMLVSCGGGKKLDKDAEGELTILLWSGDDIFHEDIGHKNLTKEDLVSQNSATIYAVAKEFNKEYPNIKINVMARSGDPDADGISWDQYRENFKLEYGKNIDIWASTNLVDEVSKGMVADLSIFKDDAMYKSFNPGIMQMMNYHGVQAGLPQYLLPWGVFVNTGLADEKNIDIPSPDWTIDEYTSFVSHSKQNEFYGSMDTPKSFIFTGTTTMAQQLNKHGADGDYINMNSDEVRSLIHYIAEWSSHSVWPQWDAGTISAEEYMDPNGWWSFNYFKNGSLLTLDGDPWMMGDAANPDPDHWGRVQSDSWDIYPRPSTDFVGNTVGVVLDPLAIHNYAMDDLDPELSDEEYEKLLLAYTFAAFWIGDDRAWEARRDQEFLDDGTFKTSMNDSFPLVTGDAFDRQMAIWFDAETHKYFKDADVTPGFHKVMELFKDGNVTDVSDKAYIWTVNVDGEKQEILHKWNNFNLPDVLTGDPDATSPRRTDAGFTDMVLSKLADWNREANENFALAAKTLESGLINYYGKKEADFN